MRARDSAAVPVIPRPWAFRQILRELGWRSNVLAVGFCYRTPQRIPSIRKKNAFHVRFEFCFADSKVRIIFLGLLKRHFVCTRVIPRVKQLHRVIFPETNVANFVVARASAECLVAAAWAGELRTPFSHGHFISQVTGVNQCERSPEPLWQPPLPPTPSPPRRRRRENSGDAVPRVAFLRRSPWATIISSLRDFSLVRRGNGSW